jgi:predicted O-methyltransferase YrrM
MSKATKGLAWMLDMVQILALDRFRPERKRESQMASTFCRTLKFHARARIRAMDLRALLKTISDVRVERVILPGPDVDLGEVGSQGGYHVLGAIVRALQPRTILEIGTYLGVSACAMALNAPADCRIFTVDLPDAAVAEAVPGLNAIDQGHIATSRHRVGEAFLQSPVAKQITQIREDTMAFRAEKWMSNVDLVYVDGGHSLAVLTKDTENAFRVLSPTGTIIWDDYFHLYPDVVSFLNKLADKYELHAIKGTNYVIYSRQRESPSGASALKP